MPACPPQPPVFPVPCPVSLHTWVPFPWNSSPQDPTRRPFLLQEEVQKRVGGAQPSPPCTFVRALGWKVQQVSWLNCTRTSPRSVMWCTVPICPINCGRSWRLWLGVQRMWGGEGTGPVGGAAHLHHPGVPPAVAFLHLSQDICV